jgi:hypothetical protein
MTPPKVEKITKNHAQRAFDYAVCQLTCKDNSRTESEKCIKRKIPCPTREAFIKKMNS